MTKPDYAQECGKCQFFKSAPTKSGRVDKKHCGTCTYDVIWPAAPMSIQWREPHKRGVWFDQNAESCRCYRGVEVIDKVDNQLPMSCVRVAND